MADYLMNIKAVCEQARRIARRLGGAPDNWNVLLADCAESCGVAERTYAAR
jgi:hypothetical protein